MATRTPTEHILCYKTSSQILAYIPRQEAQWHIITLKGRVSGFGLPKTAAQTLHFWNPKPHPTSTFFGGVYVFLTVHRTHVASQGTIS
jgi:hypothetical protein